MSVMPASVCALHLRGRAGPVDCSASGRSSRRTTTSNSSNAGTKRQMATPRARSRSRKRSSSTNRAPNAGPPVAPTSASAASPWSSLRQRVTTVGGIVVFCLAGFYVYPPLLAACVVAVAIDEYHMMVRRDVRGSHAATRDSTEKRNSSSAADELTKREIQNELLLCPPATRRSRILHVLEAVAIVGSAAVGGHEWMTFTTVLVCMGIAVAAMLHDSSVGGDIYLLKKARDSTGPTVSHFHTLCVDTLGQIYVSFLWAHAVLLLTPVTLHNLYPTNHKQYEALTIATIIFITGMGENGGFVGGSLIGGRKLISKVSPKKTVAGFVAQVLTSTACAVGIAYIPYKPVGYTTLDGLVLGTLLGILGAVGDLFESYIKRSHGLKDSNSLIELPGVGGVLDRIDGLLFNFATTYYFYRYRGFL